MQQETPVGTPQLADLSPLLYLCCPQLEAHAKEQQGTQAGLHIVG